MRGGGDMAQDFYGRWNVAVVRDRLPFFNDRFTITGADIGDGIYPGTVGTSVQVEGSHWQIVFSSKLDRESDWQTSLDRRISAEFLFDRGLVVVVETDVDARFTFDSGFIVSFQNTDPQLNPWVPIIKTLDFTLDIVAG
jgi:hypothetical protein